MSSGTTGLQVVDRVKSGIFGRLMRYDPRLLVIVGIGFGAPIRTWWFGGAVCLIKATPENLVARDVRGMILSPRQLQTLLSRLRLRLTPNLALTYGPTETTTVAICPARMKDKDPRMKGVVIPWVEMEEAGHHRLLYRRNLEDPAHHRRLALESPPARGRG